MKVRTVKRYYCDYCNKKNLSSFHMKKHEAHCTMNPNRTCRMCAAYGQEQPKLTDLMAILPDPAEYAHSDEMCDWFDGQLNKKISEILPALKNAAGDGQCPACIMAAFRQKKIPLPLVEKCGWNFNEESTKFWKDVNEHNRPLNEYY